MITVFVKSKHKPEIYPTKQFNNTLTQIWIKSTRES